MRFLADESCDFAVVRALRDAGHDVLPVAEIAQAAADSVVLDSAVRQKRILLTEDKDFGQWVYADKQATAGVVLLRYPPQARRRVADVMVRLVEHHGKELAGCFAVVQPGKVRIARQKS